MRLVGMIITAALGIAVIAEGAYIVRTRSQLANLSERLENLSNIEHLDDGRRAAPPSLGRGYGDFEADRDLGAEGETAPRGRALPRFVPAPAAAPPQNDDPLPLPAAITSPEAREQLRKFIVAQLERERQEARARDDERRDQRTREQRERMAKELGLSQAETEKFTQLSLKADAARASMRERIESGQVDRATIRQEMMALRSDTDKEMRALLGDQRMQKLDQLRRDQGGPGDGPFMGRGFRGGGPGGGGAERLGGGERPSGAGGPPRP
jgi:DNA-binding transcriptional regulator YdaS (Cro superfamily)